MLWCYQHLIYGQKQMVAEVNRIELAFIVSRRIQLSHKHHVKVRKKVPKLLKIGS